MPDERYIRSALTDRLPENFDFISLCDDEDGFCIIVGTPDSKRFSIKFWNPDAYRNADEGKRLKTLSALHVHAGIYGVENSGLADWLHDESGYTRDMKLKTWAVVTINDWIEIVGEEPVVIELPGDENKKTKP